MTRTDNLNLCTWVGSDPVSMEEMNENFRTLDAAGGRSNALLEPLLWNTAGQVLDTMQLGATGQYVEGMLADTLKNAGKLASYEHVFIAGDAQFLSAQGMVQCGYGGAAGNATPGAATTGCRYIEHPNTNSSTSGAVMLIMTPYNYYHATSLTVVMAGSHYSEHDIRVTDETGATVWSGHVPTTPTNKTVTVSVDMVLRPDKVYTVTAKATQNASCLLTALYFSGTEVIYTSGSMLTAALTVPMGASRARVMMHVESPADVSVKLIAGSSQITMQKAAAEDDSLPGGNTNCKLLRFSCTLPEGCAQAALEITLGAAAAKVFDYAMILV